MNKKTNLSKHSMPNHALRVITFVHVKCNKTNCHTQQFSSTTLQVPYVFQFNYSWITHYTNRNVTCTVWCTRFTNRRSCIHNTWPRSKTGTCTYTVRQSGIFTLIGFLHISVMQQLIYNVWNKSKKYNISIFWYQPFILFLLYKLTYVNIHVDTIISFFQNINGS